jgi:hypothetical protein
MKSKKSPHKQLFAQGEQLLVGEQVPTANKPASHKRRRTSYTHGGRTKSTLETVRVQAAQQREEERLSAQLLG